jgi:hypothetical protein
MKHVLRMASVGDNRPSAISMYKSLLSNRKLSPLFFRVQNRVSSSSFHHLIWATSAMLLFTQVAVAALTLFNVRSY